MMAIGVNNSVIVNVSITVTTALFCYVSRFFGMMI